LACGQLRRFLQYLPRGPEPLDRYAGGCPAA
jgi:hypothetical protein